MNVIFAVDRKRLFKSLTFYILFAIYLPLFFILSLHCFFSLAKNENPFKNVEQTLFFLFICIPIISVAFSLLVASWYSLATIKITNEEIHGRNYWGFRNRIPLREITKLSEFSNNGIQAIVVHSQNHGNIYISEKTQRLDELLRLLDDYISDVEEQCA